MKSDSKHWDSIFLETEDSRLGWYEENPRQMLNLLKQIENWQDATLFIAGAGTSTLVDELVSKEIKLILNDISIEALNSIQARLSKPKREITYLCQDISYPLAKLTTSIDIWVDRAVLHFLIDKKSIQGYFDNIRANLSQNGYVILVEFSQIGAKKCAGLPVHCYSVEELSQCLGDSFKLLSSFDYTFINPRGEQRPYIYTLFQRIS